MTISVCDLKEKQRKRSTGTLRWGNYSNVNICLNQTDQDLELHIFFYIDKFVRHSNFVALDITNGNLYIVSENRQNERNEYYDSYSFKELDEDSFKKLAKQNSEYLFSLLENYSKETYKDYLKISAASRKAYGVYLEHQDQDKVYVAMVQDENRINSITYAEFSLEQYQLYCEEWPCIVIRMNAPGAMASYALLYGQEKQIELSYQFMESLPKPECEEKETPTKLLVLNSYGSQIGYAINCDPAWMKEKIQKIKAAIVARQAEREKRTELTNNIKKQVVKVAKKLFSKNNHL